MTRLSIWLRRERLRRGVESLYSSLLRERGFDSVEYLHHVALARLRLDLYVLRRGLPPPI